MTSLRFKKASLVNEDFKDVDKELKRIEQEMRTQQNKSILECHEKLVADGKGEQAKILRAKYKSLFPTPTDITNDMKDWKQMVVKMEQRRIVAENLKKKLDTAMVDVERCEAKIVEYRSKFEAFGASVWQDYVGSQGKCGLSIDEFTQVVQTKTREMYIENKSAKKKFEQAYSQELDTTMTEPEDGEHLSGDEPEEEEGLYYVDVNCASPVGDDSHSH